MTSESRRLSRNPGTVILVRSTLGMAAAVMVAALVGLAAAGVDAFATVLTSGVVTGLVLSLGSFAVNIVARVMPSASLLVALMTYALQLAVLTAFMAVASDSPDWGRSLVPGWFAAGVIVSVLVWAVLQVVLQVRARIPAYDLPSRDKEADR